MRAESRFLLDQLLRVFLIRSGGRRGRIRCGVGDRGRTLVLVLCAPLLIVGDGFAAVVINLQENDNDIMSMRIKQRETDKGQGEVQKGRVQRGRDVPWRRPSPRRAPSERSSRRLMRRRRRNSPSRLRSSSGRGPPSSPLRMTRPG